MNKNESQKILKLNYEGVVKRIPNFEVTSLDDLKTLANMKFDKLPSNLVCIAKFQNGEKLRLSDKDSINTAYSSAKINKQGNRVLVVKLRERSRDNNKQGHGQGQAKQVLQFVPEMIQKNDEKKVTFENWKNLTKEEKIELKERAFSRAKRICGKSITTTSSSDSSESPSRPFKGFRKIIQKKVFNNPVVQKGPFRRQLMKDLKQEFKQLVDQKLANIDQSVAKGKGKGEDWFPGKFMLERLQKEWTPARWELFETLVSRFPQMPKMKIGKIMKRNEAKGETELSELIAKKINSVQLNTEQLKSYDLLREDFPRMPEFVLKKVIVNNPDADIEKLKKRAAKKRDNKRAKMGMMVMKGKCGSKSRSIGRGKQHKGPHGNPGMFAGNQTGFGGGCGCNRPRWNDFM